MNAHVVLVSPGHLSTNPRLVKEADALAGAGYRVTTITGEFLPWARRTDVEFEDRPWTRIRVPFGPKSGRARWVAQTAIRELARRLPGERADALGFHSAVWPLTRAAHAVRGDLYIAHNLAALPAAGNAAAINGGALGFDAEDDHVEELADVPANSDERARRDRILRAWLPRCRHRTASAPLIAQGLHARYGVPFTVIHNVFDGNGTRPGDHGTDSGPVRLYWFSQTLGPGRGLESVFDALSRVSVPFRLTLRGHTDRNEKAWLEEQLSRHGLESRVDVEGPALPGRMVDLASEHHVGLAIDLGDVPNRQRCLSNKGFTYLAAGLAIALSDTEAHRKWLGEIKDAAIVVPMDDPVAIASALDDLCAPSRLAAARAASRRWASQWSWRLEQSSFLASVDRALQAARIGAGGRLGAQ